MALLRCHDSGIDRNSQAFPCSPTIPKQNGTSLIALETVLRSPQWIAYATAEDRIYFVDVATNGLSR